MSATRRALAATKSQRIFVTWQSATLFLAGVVALVAGWKFLASGPDPDAMQGMPALNSVYTQFRPIELRLSGGFPAGRFDPEAREGALVDRNKLETAQWLILERAQSSDDLQANLAYARFALCEQASTEAQELLTPLIGRFPDSPDVQNEMGICLFEQGKIEDAIKRFDTAIELAPGMPEPLFNRAVCYQKLHLLDGATRELLRAKEVEKDKGWLDEIDARIKEISRLTMHRQAEEESALSLEAAINARDREGTDRILNQSFESLWRYSLVDLPQKYMEARFKKDSALAAKLHRRMDLIGQAIFDAKKDSYVRELFAHLHNTPDSEVEIELKLLRDYWEGAKRANSRDQSALGLLKRVSRDYKSRGNLPLLALSDYTCSIPLLEAGRNQEAINLLKASLAMVEEHPWPLHRSFTLSQLCNGYVRTGELSLAIKISNEALEIFKDRPAVRAKTLQHLGAAYWQLGNFDKSLQFLQESTHSFLTAGSGPAKMSLLYNNIGYNHLNMGDIYSVRRNHTLALENLEQSVKFYNLGGGGLSLAEALALKATEEANMGRLEAADESLKQAFAVVAATKNGASSYEGKWTLIRAGDIALQKREWKQAEDYFTKAERNPLEKATGLNLRIRALRGLSEAATRMGQADKARRSLDAAIGLVENYRVKIHEDVNRISYLDAVQSIFDHRVSLELESYGNAEVAFDLAERSRGRSLLDEIKDKKREGPQPEATKASGKLTNPLPSRPLVRPLKLKEIQSQLPVNLALIMYTVTSEGTYAFVADRKSLKWKKLGLKSDDVERETGEYLTELSNVGDLKALTEKASRLYQGLFEPIRPLVPEGSTLCIIPDKSMSRLPMAALVDGSGRYLVESFTITDAPSASVLIESLNKARSQPAPEKERLLIVANAIYSREEFPNLQPISETEMEAEWVRKLYSPDSIALIRGQATEPRVTAAIRDCDVAHFALHVLVEEQSPWLAGIVLAAPASKQGQADSDSGGAARREPGLSLSLSKEVSHDPDDGLLYLSEIYNIGLTRTRLVVLSGCQSGLGQFYRGEGMVSLVKPFLASNVPTVLASLWAVNSGATSDLMIDFHRERKNGPKGAGDALRAAQIRMARGDGPLNHPYYWAPFIVVGGNN